MFVWLLLMFGCSELPLKSSPGVPTDPSLMSVQNCIEFSDESLAFGDKIVGESAEPQTLTLVDACGILEMLDGTLDDPDNAFEMQWTFEDTVEFTLVKDIPGAWEAQWILQAIDESNPEVTGSVTVQLYGEVVAQEES